ncbi:MAG: Lipopolysaccharide export system permease protein LptG [Syntrophus sp. SKADARSKE-3]|nr:Lipopolysaccharide export system permease protein LptG [Syntrophus sp. SKADARSKE-3]
MKLLDRYIIKEFITIFLFILAAIISVYLLIDFFSKIRMFMSNNATIGQMASHFFFMIPMIISQTTPAIVLLSTLLTFGTFSKHSEIVAMKANGVSLYRMALPVMVIGVLICIFLFLFSEFITPQSYYKAEYIRLVEVQKQEVLGTFKQNQIWYRGTKGIYNFKYFDVKTNTLNGITLNYLNSNFVLEKRIDAEKAVWQKNSWVFYNVLVTTLQEGAFPVLERASTKIIDLPETPDQFKTVQKDADKMGFFELWNYIRKLQSEGYDATRYLVDLHGKIAISLVSVLLVVIGICFSVRSERSGGVAQSIGAGVIIGFSYWLIFAFSLSLGRSGTIPPILSAWFANFLFGVAAVVMIRRVST